MVYNIMMPDQIAEGLEETLESVLAEIMWETSEVEGEDSLDEMSMGSGAVAGYSLPITTKSKPKKSLPKKK
jgi:hypothetical protein